MSRESEIANLLRQAQASNNLAEQREFVRQAEALKAEAAESKRAANEWKAEDAVIRDTLIPGRVHELHTAATDWLMELETTFDPRIASQQMVAEASLWFGRVNDDVKSYGDEYAEQARGLARRLAGKYGDAADVAERAFLDEAQRLRTQAVRSGIVREANDDLQEGVDEGEGSDPYIDLQTKSAKLQRERELAGNDLFSFLAASTVPQVGDAGAPVDNNTMGLGQNSSLPPGATDSNRSPVLQELAGTPSQDVVPVNDPGLSNSQPFPVSGNKKEANMHVQCPTCGGNGKVAVRKEAASNLPQIDQIVDGHDNPAATPYPPDVAYPWTINPAAQVGAQTQQAEQQIGERNQKSPLLQGTQASYRYANGRDNSGWIGDMGAKGTDYPGWSSPVGGPEMTGYQDPVYGQGGDQGNQQLRPYGLQEADDYTNNPGQGWAPGQPTQADQAWQSVTNNGQGSQQAGPGGSVTSAWNRAVEEDESLQAALAYVQARRASILGR